MLFKTFQRSDPSTLEGKYILVRGKRNKMIESKYLRKLMILMSIFLFIVYQDNLFHHVGRGEKYIWEYYRRNCSQFNLKTDLKMVCDFKFVFIFVTIILELIALYVPWFTFDGLLKSNLEFYKSSNS